MDLHYMTEEKEKIIMSIKSLAGYTQYSKYAKFLHEKKRRETWGELVDRVFAMHEEKFDSKINDFRDDFEWVKSLVKKKRVLGSQRALQFGGPPILRHNEKIYNCCATYIDRPRAFQESLFLLLCGCGVGFSVQKHHVNKLPKIRARDKGKKTFIIPDTIEGWADALGVLLSSYFVKENPFYVYDLQFEHDSFSGYEVEFDYSFIRPKGSTISWGGKAPGPDGLKNSLNKISKLLDGVIESGINKLRPIHVYDILMHSSDAVLSGGIRRSACLTLFSHDDDEMINAKTGDWFVKNPQRGRSNNSALLVRDEITKEQFSKLMKSVKEFGEPGFIWAEDTESLFNPCVEINLRGYDDNGNSGFEFCNLCEINMKKCSTEQDFYDSCRAAAILGTLQASYDSFPYLGEVTENIVKKEALLGVSMTGMMDNPEISFNPEIQRNGAEIIKKVNKQFSKLIGINQAARTCCVKPSGSASCLLGSSSGIHPNHSKRYIRRVQGNKLEFPVKVFKEYNPLAVEESVWSANNTDVVISFLCEVPDGAKTKNQMGAIEFLEYVKLTQQNWVESGTNKNLCVKPFMRHNVSNTITVKDDEWDEVEEYIYKNRNYFAGISLLPYSGDLDYPQSPFTTVLNDKEIVLTYGEGSLFASGLIVDGQHVFDNNLWAACDCALGMGQKIEDEEMPKEPFMPHKNGYNNKEWSKKLAEYASDLLKYHEDKEKYDMVEMKKDWIRRFNKFADRYCEGNKKKCAHMLKHVSIWKLWLDLSREYKDIDWFSVEEESYEIDVSSLAGQSCAGGKCDLGDLGNSIEESQKKVS